MKWKIKRKIEKAIEILETLIKNKNSSNSLKQKILNYFSFVYKYGSVELWNNYDDLSIHLIYENGKYFIRCYHCKKMDPFYSPERIIEDIEI